MKKILALILALIFIFSSCSRSNEPYSRTDFYLGTVVTLTIYDDNAENLMDGAMAEIERLENLLSRSIDGSDINRINESAGLNGVRVSLETVEVIEKGIEFYNISEGLFDITIGPLVDLWGIGTESAGVPKEEERLAAIDNIGIEAIETDGNLVFLASSGMKLETGGIAKGYIADKVAEYLRENNCEAAVINLGGNVLTLGKKPDGSTWKIGIQNPFESTGTYIRVVEVDEKSVVTSGPYERFFEENGTVYHHILNPFTGYPVDSDIAGVSIISDKSMDGDGLSTTVFALGSEKGMALIETIGDAECIIILKDGNIEYSSGLLQYLD